MLAAHRSPCPDEPSPSEGRGLSSMAGQILLLCIERDSLAADTVSLPLLTASVCTVCMHRGKHEASSCSAFHHHSYFAIYCIAPTGGAYSRI